MHKKIITFFISFAVIVIGGGHPLTLDPPPPTWTLSPTLPKRPHPPTPILTDLCYRYRHGRLPHTHE